MKTKLAVLALAALFLVSCSMFQGTQKPSQILKPVVQTEKDMAESILFTARVLQNTGNLTEEQFLQVRGAYDKLKAAQDLMVDAYSSFLQYPVAGTEANYSINVVKVIESMKTLTFLAIQFGVIKEETK